jgi:Mannosyltransferase (PIG-V)
LSAALTTLAAVVSQAAAREAPAAVRLRAVAPAAVFVAGQVLALAATWAVAVPSGWSMWALLHQWDARHFEDVAARGYTGDDYAFFPGLPLLIRLVSTVLPAGVAGVVVSVAAGVVLAYGLDRLTGQLGGDTLIPVWLTGVLPLSVVFLMPYAEATFCALAVWTLVALGRDRLLAAAGLCAAAGLVRPTAVALVLAVAVAAAVRRGRAALVAAVVAPVGVVGYLAWVAVRTGSPAGWAEQESRGWRTSFDGGAFTWSWLREIAADGPSAVDLAVLAAAIACVLTAVVLLRRLRPDAAAYVAGVVVLALGTSGVWNSKYRLLLPALVVGCALAGRPPARLRTPLRVVVLAAAAGVGCWYSAYLLTSYPYAL